MDQQTPTGKNTHQTSLPQQGRMTKDMRRVTSQIPSGGYLALAIGSMALSAAIASFSRKKALANFIGLWVPSLLLIGIYNKIVKIDGSDRMSRKPISREDYH
jgi:hypothetical protein